jgi:hypothetical protein
MTSKYKILIIDTEQYSGNFERAMCAYVTAQYGECKVGSEIADEASKNIKHVDWWCDHIVSLPDENNCHRPVDNWETPGFFNNGLGKHYKDIPENEDIAVKEAIQFMTNYNKNQITMVKNHILENNFELGNRGWTKEDCESIIKKYEDDIKRVSILHKFPAHLSVAIFVDEFPPEEVWNEFKERVYEFAKDYIEISHTSSITITGFRQII